MKDYLISVILVSAVTAIASVILPDGKGRLREQVDLVLALILLSVIIIPFGRADTFAQSIGDALSGIFESDNVYVEEEDGWLMSKREEAFEEAICREVADKFSLPSDGVSVDGTLVLAEGEIHVSSLTISLSGLAATSDNKAIKKYLSALCGVECEVVLY